MTIIVITTPTLSGRTGEGGVRNWRFSLPVGTAGSTPTKRSTSRSATTVARGFAPSALVSP
jgi:hypothetical protein